MKTISTKRNPYEINSIIRVASLSKENKTPYSWLNRFTTEKDYFKQVHVLGDRAYLMLMSTRTDKKGMFITGSLEYKLDNLPNFIKRHIDFTEVEKAKGTLNYRAFGLIFREGKLMPRF